MVYNSVLTLAWTPYELAMIVGGAILLGSALLFLYILWKSQAEGAPDANAEILYAEYEEPVAEVPALLNGFTLWNKVILVLMLVNFGYPIAQFFFIKTFGSIGWGY